MLAFEHLRYKEDLDALENIRPENIELLVQIFASLDDIEASLYHQIISGRIEVIEALESKVDKNELENVIRDYVYTHLWLLDPGWERATGAEYQESGLAKEFEDFAAGELTKEEQKSRFDIKYSKTSGSHVIIELKRPNRPVKIGQLVDQGDKYRRGLRKLLTKRKRETETIEVVFLIGEPLPGWEDPLQRQRNEDNESLQRKGMRVLLYKELLENAQRIYREYLDKRKESGRIQKLLNSIDEADIA